MVVPQFRLIQMSLGCVKSTAEANQDRWTEGQKKHRRRGEGEGRKGKGRGEGRGRGGEEREEQKRNLSPH